MVYLQYYKTFFTFRATTHDVTSRNHANSEYDTHDDENHVRNWQPFSITLIDVFIFHKMDSIVFALCKRFALSAMFALLTSAAFF
jgi:hypothetical protein